MNAKAATCPSQQSLADYGLGKLDETGSETIHRHLETCVECRQVVAGLSGDSFVNRLREAQAQPPVADAAAQRVRTFAAGESIPNVVEGSETPRPASGKRELAGAPLAGKPSGSPGLSNVPPELANHPDYEFLKKLGRGGMGVVYLARNRMMDRLEVMKVVSKSLLDRPGARERFQQEIRSAAKLAHPNVVAAYSVLQPGDLLVFAMEYVDGQDLSQVVKQRGALPVTNATFYVQQVALGLQHAHDNGMVHRDIKPNNLMLAVVNKKHVVKILDFGLAKATSEKGDDGGLTKSGQMMGTPDYIAPEQSLDAQKADIRADIYSLGCTLYYLLAGHAPFRGNSLYEILQAHHQTVARPLNLERPGVPTALAAIVAKMMAKDPANRFQTPMEVAKALNPFFKAGAAAGQSGSNRNLPPSVDVSPSLPAPIAAPNAPMPVAMPVLVPIAQPAQPLAAPVYADPLAAFSGIGAMAPTQPNKTQPFRGRRVAVSVAIGLLFVGLGVCGAVMFKFRTADGVVAIEVNEPNPEIFVDGNQATVTWDAGGKQAEITLPAGSRKIELKKDGFKAVGETVELESRGRRVPLVAVTPDMELPPVGPTKAPPADHVAQAYKAARAVCTAARQTARSELRAELQAQFLRMRDELKQGNLEDKELAKSLKQLESDRNKLACSPSNDGEGPIPTHPLMRDAVNKYLQANLAAYRKFGEVAEQGLAAYEKAGITDPVRLRPLLAARLAGEHAELLGIWEVNYPENIQYSYHTVLHIGVDENTGSWVVSSFRYGNWPTAPHCGQNIEFKDGGLTFIAVPVIEEQPQKPSRVRPSTPKKRGAAGSRTQSSSKSKSPAAAKPQEAAQADSSVKPGGNIMTLKLHNGELHCETRGGSDPTVLVLRRTDAEYHNDRFNSYENKIPAQRLDAPADVVDLSNANYVWRRVAQLTSFAYYRSSGWRPLPHEALYLPYRQDHPGDLPGLGGGLYNLIRRTPTGDAVDRNRNAVLMDQFEQLSAASHPYLKKTTDQAMGLCRNRLRIAMANEQYGNTGSSQLKLADGAFIACLKYGLQREADIAQRRESIQRCFPGYTVIVTDAPMSPASKQKLDELLNNVGKINQIIQQRTVVTGLLAYADMAQVDRSAIFWKTWLLPLARRCAGPVSDKPLVQVSGNWNTRWFSGDRFKRLIIFRLDNVAQEDLTHVVVELIAENELGEKAPHYYYFDRLEGADFAWLEPTPRWVKRRLAFTNTIAVTWSLWSDQGSEVGRQAKLTNPLPDPESASLCKDVLAQDQRYQAAGEAFGALMQGVVRLPFLPERQRRILSDLVVPGSSYVFQCEVRRRVRRFCVSFAPIGLKARSKPRFFDPDTQQPFKPETPIWKGQLTARGEKGVTFRVESAGNDDWGLALAFDEQPEIFCPAAGRDGALFPLREIPLFPIKLP